MDFYSVNSGSFCDNHYEPSWNMVGNGVMAQQMDSLQE
jgi:hypothetical protein